MNPETVGQKEKLAYTSRQLIEDYLPIEELNEIATKEKKHPDHPVALIHYWPARRVLVPSGLTVTEAWPLQTEARGRTNAIGAAALSDSIFLVAKRREADTKCQYEDEGSCARRI